MGLFTSRMRACWPQTRKARCFGHRGVFDSFVNPSQLQLMFPSEIVIRAGRWAQLTNMHVTQASLSLSQSLSAPLAPPASVERFCRPPCVTSMIEESSVNKSAVLSKEDAEVS